MLEMLIKIPNINGLLATTVLNTKIMKAKFLILVVQSLLQVLIQKLEKSKIKFLTLVVQLKKNDYDAKIKDIKKKYFTTADYNEVTMDILDAKIKQKELVNKSEIADFVKLKILCEFDRKLIHIGKKQLLQTKLDMQR